MPQAAEDGGTATPLRNAGRPDVCDRPGGRCVGSQAGNAGSFIRRPGGDRRPIRSPTGHQRPGRLFRNHVDLSPGQLREGEAGGDLGFAVIGPVVLARGQLDHGDLRVLDRDASDALRALVRLLRTRRTRGCAPRRLGAGLRSWMKACGRPAASLKRLVRTIRI